MPEAVTEAFKKVQKSHSFPVAYQLLYKRRYWDTGTQKYIWEASWNTLPNSQIRSLGTLTQRLDTNQLNEFLTSNSTITLDNSFGTWEVGTTRSKFAADLVATDGYLPNLTKFKISVGLEVNGVNEYVSQFVGYAVKFQTQSKNKTVSISLEGREKILKLADAENVSNRYTLQAGQGTIDGANKVFTTANLGVARITAAQVDGVYLLIGTDCTVTDLADPLLPATITFKTAPASSVKLTYFCWKIDQSFEVLMAELLEEAGLTSSEYTIDPVIFLNNVLNEEVFNTQARWDAGIKRDADSVTKPNYLKFGVIDDFEDGDIAANPAWTVLHDAGSASVVGNVFTMPTPSWETGLFLLPRTEAYGTWQLRPWTSNTNLSYMRMWIISGALSGTNPYNGYYIEIQYSSYTGGSISFHRVDAVGVTTELYRTNYSPSEGRTIQITRTSAGIFSIYIDGSLITTLTDATHITSTGFYIQNSSGSAASVQYLRSIYFFSDGYAVGTGSWTSAAFDATAANKAWGLTTSVHDANGATVLRETYSSSSSDFSTGNDPAGWVTASANGQINSIVNRYIKVRMTWTFKDPWSTIYYPSPVIESMSINYVTSTTKIALADFTSMSVYDALSELVKMPDYEMGFDANEHFFIRQKTAPGDEDFTFDETGGLIEIMSMYENLSKVYNTIRVGYGEYLYKVSSETEAEAHPHSIDKYGVHPLEISGGQMVLNTGVDIATGIALNFFARNKLPRISAQIKVKFYPQVALSDVVKMRFDPRSELERIRWDDGVSAWDGLTLRWDGFRTRIIEHINCKVVGRMLSMDSKTVTLELEEIL